MIESTRQLAVPRARSSPIDRSGPVLGALHGVLVASVMSLLGCTWVPKIDDEEQARVVLFVDDDGKEIGTPILGAIELRDLKDRKTSACVRLRVTSPLELEPSDDLPMREGERRAFTIRSSSSSTGVVRATLSSARDAAGVCSGEVLWETQRRVAFSNAPTEGSEGGDDAGTSEGLEDAEVDSMDAGGAP